MEPHERIALPITELDRDTSTKVSALLFGWFAVDRVSCYSNWCTWGSRVMDLL